ncbi:MAG: FHA domain-containing protein [Chloroflexota bacterium]
MAISLNNGQQRDQEEPAQTDLLQDYDDSTAAQTKIPKAPIEDTPTNQRQLLMWLIVSSPAEQRGMVLPVSNQSVIGRHGDITWHDPRMSRLHARFMIMDDPLSNREQIFGIRPEKDRNGTIVNRQRINYLTPLRENDVIIMGNTHFVVKVLK